MAVLAEVSHTTVSDRLYFGCFHLQHVLLALSTATPAACRLLTAEIALLDHSMQTRVKLCARNVQLASTTVTHAAARLTSACLALLGSTALQAKKTALM